MVMKTPRMAMDSAAPPAVRRAHYRRYVMTAAVFMLWAAAALGADATEVYVPSYDGVFVAAAMRKPEGSGLFPAVLIIHGGRGGTGFKAAVEAASGRVPDEFIKRGYAVIATDYRRYHVGDEEVQDILASYKKLQSYPFVDPKRVAIMGSSHGGQLCLLAATRIQPAAVVSLAGVVNMTERFYYLSQQALRQFKDYEGWRQKLSEARGLDEIPVELAWRFGERRELYEGISPKSHPDKIQSPVLFLVGGEGGGDWTRFTGKLFIENLKALGKTAAYSEHAAMPHGFYWGAGANPPQQFFDALKVMTEFVDLHVKNKK